MKISKASPTWTFTVATERGHQLGDPVVKCSPSEPVTATAGAQLFTLPANLRPDAAVTTACRASTAVVHVSTDGRVTLIGSDTRDITELELCLPGAESMTAQG